MNTPSIRNEASNEELLSLIGNLSQALYIMLACERCWGTGSITTINGPDECPLCHGDMSSHPRALNYVTDVARRCETLSIGCGETA